MYGDFHSSAINGRHKHNYNVNNTVLGWVEIFSLRFWDPTFWLLLT